MNPSRVIIEGWGDAEASEIFPPPKKVKPPPYKYEDGLFKHPLQVRSYHQPEFNQVKVRQSTPRPEIMV
jgi:hypothetical protein